MLAGLEERAEPLLLALTERDELWRALEQVDDDGLELVDLLELELRHRGKQEEGLPGAEVDVERERARS